MPIRVKDVFSYAGLGEFRRRHIADDDVIEVTHDLRGGLLQKIRTAVRNLGVDTGDLLFLSGPLRDGETLFQLPVMARVFG